MNTFTYTFGLRGCYMPDDVCDVEFSDADEMRRDIIQTLLGAADWEDLSEDAREDLTHAAEDINLASADTLLNGVAVNFGQYRMEWARS